MSSAIPSARKSRPTSLTPLQYPPTSPNGSSDHQQQQQQQQQNYSNRNDAIVMDVYQQRKFTKPETIVVSPYENQQKAKNQWTPQKEFWFRLVLTICVLGIITCVGIIVHALNWDRRFLAFVFGGDPDDYFRSRIEHDPADDPQRTKSSSDSTSSSAKQGFFSSLFFGKPKKDPSMMNAFERADLVKEEKERLASIRDRLSESKIRLANVLEEKVWRYSTIFVSVAAYRDVECLITVEDIYASSNNPRRVFLGIIEQNEHGDPICIPDKMFKDCIEQEEKVSKNKFFCPIDNIRRRKVVAIKGRGPTYGRYVSMLMYRGESYYMMIDSHNRFRPGWDSEAIKMIFVAESPKPVLSHYPLAWKKDMDVSKMNPYVTVMCRSHFVQWGYVRMGGLNFMKSRRPRLQPFTAAGFLFADAAMVHEVPFDPHLDFLFDGEELLYSSRLYTHGWDAFAPSWNLVFHDYDRHTAPRFWHTPQNSWGVHQQRAVKRVQWILKIPKLNKKDEVIVDDEEASKVPQITAEIEKYGLGTQRTLESFWKFANVDLVRKIDGEGMCYKYGKRR